MLGEGAGRTPTRANLLNKLFNIEPGAFERLAQRLLRESGFVQVEVTGKTGDGGIDGKGIVKISGFLSFHVIFQCKLKEFKLGVDTKVIEAVEIKAEWFDKL